MKKLILVGLCMFLLVGIVNADTILCYQESVNLTSDCSGTCTCYDTGKYSETFITSGSAVYDGSFSTFITDVTPPSEAVYFNYTKPDDVLNGTKWRVKDGNAELNLTIPITCFDFNLTALHLKVTSEVGFETNIAAWYCYNLSGWGLLRKTTLSSNIYEEGVYWNTTEAPPPPAPPQLNITSISKTSKLTINKGGMLTISK